jgi:hypothetical protein
MAFPRQGRPFRGGWPNPKPSNRKGERKQPRPHIEAKTPNKGKENSEKHICRIIFAVILEAHF